MVADAPEALPEADLRHLLDQAEDLYWNELHWEHLTEEEQLPGLEHTGALSSEASRIEASKIPARLLKERGEGESARTALAPVLDQLTEGRRTADLLAARALLDELPA